MEKNIGILYERHGQKGTFYTGFVEVNGVKQEIVIFRNNRPKNDKSPHFFILPKQPKQESFQNTNQTQYQGNRTESWGQPKGSVSSKQLGFLYHTAAQNGWPREAVVKAVQDNCHYSPEMLDRERFQSALNYFKNNRYTAQDQTRAQEDRYIPKKEVKNYAPQSNEDFGPPPEWVTQGPPDEELPF